MMRIKSGIICVVSMSLAFAFACANSAAPGDDDDGTGGSQQEISCGDAVCDASEVGICTADCGSGGSNNNNDDAVCGNGTCESTKGETASTCSSDCLTPATCNNNGTCDAGETTANCAADCGSTGTLDCADPLTLIGCFGCISDPTACVAPFDSASCNACLGGGGGGFGDLLCEGGAPDGVCNAAAGEDNTTCPSDCP